MNNYLSVGPLGREITDIGTVGRGCTAAAAVFCAALGLLKEKTANVHHLHPAAVQHAQVVGYHIMVGGLARRGRQRGVCQGLGGHRSLPHAPWWESLLAVVVVTGKTLRQLSIGTGCVVQVAAGHDVQGVLVVVVVVVVVAGGDDATAAGANVHVPTCHQWG